MDADEIKHFLVSRTKTGEVSVREFGNDMEAAVQAYGEAERAAGWDGPDVVLLGADSLETIKKTHSSWFATDASDRLDDLLLGYFD